MNIFAQWVSLPSNTVNSLNDITFTSLDTGFIVGDNGIILRTTNGGNSWSKISNPLKYNLNTIHFPSKIVGYTNGLKTINGGITWDSLKTIYNRFINSYFFINESIGFLASSNTYYAKTINGGLTWDYQSSKPVSQVLEKVEFTSDSIGYMVGWYGGNVLKTIDQGNSWFQVNNEQLTSIKFPTPDTGYVVGWYGKILKTIDAGNNWIELTSGLPNNHLLNEIYCITSSRCYVVGDKGAILKTVDGGKNWMQEISGNKRNLNSVYCYDNSCFAVGDSGTILKTNFVSTKIISKDNSQKTISVFPNPSNGFLTITLNLGFNQIFHFEIFNSLGEKISTNPLLNKINNIDLTSLRNGFYFYEITSDMEIIKTGKIIKQ